MELKIIGKPTDNIILDLKKVLEYNPNKNNFEIVLFCDYSEFDIYTGQIFKSIEILNTQTEFPVLIELLKVTQELFLPFDYIPKGYKTICKFRLLNEMPTQLTTGLPKVKNWYDGEIVWKLKG